jgi:hypothetical protein
MTHDQIAQLLQVALLGEVSAALRGVGFSLGGQDVILQFYFDGPISDEDRESASSIETEVIARLPDEARVSTNLMRSDMPARMTDPERWVFRRRE